MSHFRSSLCILVLAITGLIVPYVGAADGDCSCAQTLPTPSNDFFQGVVDFSVCSDTTSPCKTSTLETFYDSKTPGTVTRAIIGDYIDPRPYPSYKVIGIYQQSVQGKPTRLWIFGNAGQCMHTDIPTVEKILGGVPLDTAFWAPTTSSDAACKCAPQDQTTCVAGSGNGGILYGTQTNTTATSVVKSQRIVGGGGVETVITSNEGLPQMYCAAKRDTSSGRLGPGIAVRYSNFQSPPHRVNIPRNCPKM